MSNMRAPPTWFKPEAKPNPELKLFNSMTNTKEDFVTTKPSSIGWYVCGPTVYDSAHIGHARNYVTFDIMRRVLEDYFGYRVFSVMNITDVDDKIIRRARCNYLLEQFVKSKPDRQTAKEILQSAWNRYIEAFERNIQTNKDLIQELKAKEQLDKFESQELKEAEGTIDLYEKSLHDARVKSQEIIKSLDSSDASIDQLIQQSLNPIGELLDDREGDKVTDLEIFRNHASRYEEEFMEDMETLGVRSADVLTRVSEYIPEIIAYIEKIISNGFAYESKGSVYFDTQQFDKQDNHYYAKLKPTAMGDGTASKFPERKCDNDFALWKKAKPGEPRWDSPWGEGRPGWHIECSAMASELLGETLDIHCGGEDLKFPHHDNELAQSEAYYGCKQWVNYFLHSGHLNIEGLKMSKSLKNFITIRQALEHYTPRQLRLYFLFTRWGNVMNYQKVGIETAIDKEETFNQFFLFVQNVLHKQGHGAQVSQRWGKAEFELHNFLLETQEKVHEYLCDNMNTPDVMNALLSLVSKANAYGKGNTQRKGLLLRKVAVYVTRMLRIFGVITEPVEIGFGDSSGVEGNISKVDIIRPYIDAFAQFRADIRGAAKEGKSGQDMLTISDHVRDEIMLPLGIEFEDAGDFLWKSGDPQQLIEKRERKRAEERKKLVQKRAKALQAKDRDIAKWEAAKIPTEEALKDKYSKFNDEGFPTHDLEGKELAGKGIKKAQKAFDGHMKKHKKYLEEIAKKPTFLNDLVAERDRLAAELKEMQ